ncbi:hypothetical protein LguiB_032450 [Lonicera macranthoides]
MEAKKGGWYTNRDLQQDVNSLSLLGELGFAGGDQRELGGVIFDSLLLFCKIIVTSPANYLAFYVLNLDSLLWEMMSKGGQPPAARLAIESMIRNLVVVMMKKGKGIVGERFG